ncbi:MAG: SPFH domain-containing protein [Desulfovibrionaceae bacterium]
MIDLPSLSGSLIVLVLLAVLLVIVLIKTALIVPQRSQFIVERLGKYHKTLDAGFHILVPFIDKPAYRFTLKEEVLDTIAQTCITRDNVTVQVDGLIYVQVINSKDAAYGINDYRLAASQLAQTTLRSVIGKIDLDKTFEERDNINAQVVQAIDEAAASWGIKVLRYEVKDITPPESVRKAMEAQMTAEREKRAAIATSEGERQSMINRAEGAKQNAVLKSEGEQQRLINEADGQAAQIRRLAEATAEGVKRIAEAVSLEGGLNAANLRIAEKYIAEFGNLAQESTTLIVPQNLTDIAGLTSTIMATLKGDSPKTG